MAMAIALASIMVLQGRSAPQAFTSVNMLVRPCRGASSAFKSLEVFLEAASDPKHGFAGSLAPELHGNEIENGIQPGSKL
jgi:hypothetical protein